MQSPAEVFAVEAGNEVGDLLLGDRGRQIDVPGGEAGKGL